MAAAVARLTSRRSQVRALHRPWLQRPVAAGLAHDEVALEWRNHDQGEEQQSLNSRNQPFGTHHEFVGQHQVEGNRDRDGELRWPQGIPFLGAPVQVPKLTPQMLGIGLLLCARARGGWIGQA